MLEANAADRPSRGHKKRERTRAQLIEAGLEVLAEVGEALKISDVVERASVSNGTFYNYFNDRDELIDVLAETSLLRFAAEVDAASAEDDPARRFAAATTAVLSRAVEDPTWGRAILRLADHRRSLDREASRYIRDDLAAGFDSGRFAFGPDDITLDALIGLNSMAMRRIVRGDAGPDYVRRVVERALRIVGISAGDAADLARDVGPL